MSVAEVLTPLTSVVILTSVVSVGASVLISEVLLIAVMGGNCLVLVVVVIVVVGVGCADLLGMGVVVSTLGDDVVVTGKSHSEVKGLVLGILVVVGVVLVTVGVLRGHVVVGGVLIVVRVGLVWVTLVVLVSGGVVSLVMGTDDMAVLGTDVAASVTSIMADDVVRLSLVGSLVVSNSGVMHWDLVVHWDNSGVVRGLDMSNSWVSNNMRSLVVDGS